MRTFRHAIDSTAVLQHAIRALRATLETMRPRALLRTLRTLGVSFLLALTLLAGANGPLAAGFGIAGFGIGRPEIAQAAGRGSQGTPNRFDPRAQATSVNHFRPAQTSSKAATLSSPRNVIRSTAFPMKPGTLALDPGKAARFTGSDGRLEIDVPAGAITPADVATAAGGALSLRITQIAPASGSAGGGSGLISFGTYLVQVVDGQGHLASQGLRQPITLRLHYGRAGAGNLDHAFVVINGSLPVSVTTATVATPTSAAAGATATPNPAAASVTAKQIGLGSYHTQNTTLDTHQQTLTISPLLNTPSSSLSWNTNSNLSAFGKPDPFSADLSGGALTAGLPIDVPAGPGGLTPPITLAYSSAGVSEQHSPQGAAGWVGEGWNLSTGSITWTEKNYTSYCHASGNSCTNPDTWQSTWQLSDPFGTSSELIPPNDTVSTFYDDTPNTYYNGSSYPNQPVTWHTANESYAKIVSYVGPLTVLNENANPSCFRVWLKNGLMEEFGCTNDSLQSYVAVPVDNPNNPPQYYVSGWLLDMVTDPQGNQIHFTYQPDGEQSHGKTYPRDVVLQTIEWDSPGCRDPQNMCISNWHPLMRVSFAASHNRAAHLTNSPSGCNTSDANIRCDDPLDLTSGGGMAAPQVQSTFVLNDVQVQVRGSGTGSWNMLRDYQLSYEQNGPHTITDPATGKSESVAGMLDLTKFQQLGTDQNTGTGLPLRTFGYTSYDEHYEDAVYKPNPSNNCGPSWNQGSGSGCLLWSTSYAGNDRYLTSASNGLGLAQTFTYAEARNNTHGVNGGTATTIPNPLYCNTLSSSQQAAYPCSEADDQNWSRMVLTQQQGTVNRLTQNGQGGQQTTTPVISTTGYQYTLTYPLVGNWCGDCVAGMYWGDQTDGDYLDYYNATFMGFAQTQVANPDKSVVVHMFYGTEGYGYYDKSQFTCNRGNSNQCNNTPWSHLTNAAHGHEYETDVYDVGGSTLLKKSTTQYKAVCPPPGVSATPPVTGYGTFNGNRVAELDLANPVMVCDVRTIQTDDYTYDGSTATGVPDQTVTYGTNGNGYSYDSAGHLQSVTTTTSSNDGGATGSPTSITHTTSYIWNDAVSTAWNSATGRYLVEFPALSYTADSAGATRYNCSYTSYDGHAYATGQQSGLTLGEVTTSDHYWQSCGTSPNWTPSGLIETKHTYDQWGNQVTTTDPDANGGNTAHLGCTVGSTQYSACTAVDTTFDTLPISSTNALNQTETTGYNATTDATGGFGLWPTSTTEKNGQTTSYGYDTLGRMTSRTLPSEANPPTSSWVYTDWCGTLSNPTGPQAPCLEIDQKQQLNSSNSIITRAFYDGWGNLVETRSPGPAGQDVVQYRHYDSSGRDIFESVAYFVSAYTGTQPGPNAFSIPDSTQPGRKLADTTWSGYDGLGRVIKAQDALSNTALTSYTVVCGAAGTGGDGACYEQTLGQDPLGHQQGTLTDALGREVYDQRYTGTSTYALYATTRYTYDYNGNLVTITQPDGTTTTTFQYDLAGRKTGMVDPDKGTESYTVDANGNRLTSVDGRGVTVYAGYDGLDRQLWRNTSNSPTGAYVTYTYDGGTGCSGTYLVGHLCHEAFTGGPNNTLSGSYTFSYDKRGEQTSETETVGTSSYTIGTSYDDTSNVTSQTYPDGETVSYGYTGQGWLQSLQVQLGAGQPTMVLNNATYTGAGGAGHLITGATLGGTQANPTYQYGTTYDTLLRLTDVNLTYNGSQQFDQTRAFDAVGNVTNITTTLGLGAVDTQAFCYDEQDRLVWAGTGGASPGPPTGCPTPASGDTLTTAQYSASYAYDTLGRLTSASGLGSFTYGPGQQAPTNPSPLHAALSLGGSGYSATYDRAGNMTCRAPTSSTSCAVNSPTPGAQLSWDSEERLSAWQDKPTSPTTTAAFLSDGEGNRLEQQVTTSGLGGGTTTYTYVGNLEKVATTSGPTTTTTTTTYYYAGSQLIALSTGGGSFGSFTYLGADGLGSVDVVLDSNGNLSGSRLYGPYGNTRYQTGTWPAARGFTGQWADGPTGLDLFGSRYYDPSADQFISADSVLPGNGYDLLGLSRYAYVEGNPESRTDPTGHDWFSSIVNTVAAVAAPVVAAVAPVVAAVAPVASAVLDATTGIPSMINDVHTIFFDPKASFLDKVLAGGDLLMNVAMDASMLVGVGEGLRLVVAGAKVAAHIGEDVTAHAIVHAGTDAVEHVVAHEGEDVAEHAGEHAAEDAGEHAGECPNLSFAPGTLVAVPGGERAIASLKVGDAVTAYDPSSGKASVQTVQATYLNHDTNLVDVTLRVTAQPVAKASQRAEAAGAATSHDEVVHTTANHPWFTADHGWLPASFMHIGESVVRVDGTTATVEAIWAVPGAASMWDLTVSQVHTFGVGDGQYVVHNCGTTGNEPGVPGDPANKVAGQTNLYEGQAADPFELDKNGWRQAGPTRSGPVHANVFGKDFAAFLRSQGKSVAGWRYYMEEWVRGPGERIVNHFWSDMFEHPDNPLYFHHH